MGIQTYTIEMKFDAPGEHHKAMEQVIKQYARDLLASAALLSAGNNVQVACRTQDSFYGSEEIEVLEPSERLDG